MTMSDEQERHPEPDVAFGAGPAEGFLNRWSRRKREAREAGGQPAEPAAPDSPLASIPDSAESRPAEPTDADMTPLESLDEHSDYRGFLSPKVSEGLRRAALRKLFGQPRFNVCDGLDDYAQDFTSFEPLGDLVTHEMRRALACERDKLAEALEQGDASDPADQAPRLAAVDEDSGSPGTDPRLDSAPGEAEDRAAAEQAADALPDGSKQSR